MFDFYNLILATLVMTRSQDALFNQTEPFRDRFCDKYMGACDGKATDRILEKVGLD